MLIVIVSSPFENEPETRPMTAAVSVTDTSLNVGSLAGKGSLTRTSSDVPFTSIVAPAADWPELEEPTGANGSRPEKRLNDFDQSFYLTIAYDLEHHGVFSNGPFAKVDSTVARPPPGMFFGPLYPTLVLAAMKLGAVVIPATTLLVASVIGLVLATLPAVEIRPKEGWYDFAARYTHGAADFRAPAELDPAVTERCMEAAHAPPLALGCPLQHVPEQRFEADRGLVPGDLDRMLARGMVRGGH